MRLLMAWHCRIHYFIMVQNMLSYSPWIQLCQVCIHSLSHPLWSTELAHLPQQSIIDPGFIERNEYGICFSLINVMLHLWSTISVFIMDYYSLESAKCHNISFVSFGVALQLEGFIYKATHLLEASCSLVVLICTNYIASFAYVSCWVPQISTFNW